MGNEKSHTVTLKHSEVREVQLALLYHIDNVLIPFYEDIVRKQDYDPTEEVRNRIETLQRVLDKFNAAAGKYSEKD